jgi:alpha-1,3-rhamnosyl/mannosyltransferase
MHVAFDTSPILTSTAGTSRYTRSLLRALKSEQSRELRVSEFAWPVSSVGVSRLRKMAYTAYREMVWARWFSGPQIQAMGCDVYHSTANILLEPPRGVKHVVTVHDLAVLRYPERFRRWHLLSARRQLNRVNQADKLICDSRFTADEAISLLGVPARKVEVVYLGSDFNLSDAPSTERPPRPPIPNSFFLFVGALEPGKNLALLGAAYRKAHDQGRPLLPLVIVGARWRGVPTEGAPPPDWHYFGRLADEELVFMYKRARALVFPSVYEGFGLPVVEAMALGCPVVCSPVASLPEVAGDAAMMTALTVEGYVAAMRRLEADEGIVKQLRYAGLQQASRFSWRRCASETAAIYAQVAYRHS